MLATYMNVAQQHRMGEQFDAALRLSKRGSEIAQSIQSRPYLGMFRWVSAGILQRQGDLDGALAAIRQSVMLLEPGPESTDHGRVMNYALVLAAEGRILSHENGISFGQAQQALGPLDRAFAIADKAAHQDANDENSRGLVAQVGLELADVLHKSDPKRALAVYDHVLRHIAEIQHNPNLRRYELRALARSSDPLRRLCRFAEARRRLDAALDGLRQIKQYPAKAVEPGSEAEDTLRALAAFEGGTGRVAHATEICDKLLDQIQASKPQPETSLEDAVSLSNLYGQAAALHAQNGEPNLQSALQARRLELWRHWDSKLPHNAVVQSQLAAASLP